MKNIQNTNGLAVRNIPPHPAFGHPLSQGARRTSRGFTLIELLVVVLIIGILAAIAVPQYQLAVEKSRLAEALNIMSYAQKMVKLHYLEVGNDSEKWGNASEYIELPGFNDHTQYDAERFIYDFDEQICASRKGSSGYDICILGNAEENYWEAIATDNIRKTCLSYSSIGNKICKGLEKDGYEITLYQE